jgi:hypothetical protein
MKRWIAAVTMVLAFSPVAWPQAVHFNDPNLKAAVKEALGIMHDPTWTVADRTTICICVY